MSMNPKTFKRGGVHPPENKRSANSPIRTLGLPRQVSILLQQHLGAPAEPIVKTGDKVKVGTLIGRKGKAFISANVHSSVSGTVAKIDDVLDFTGYKKPAVIIDVEGDEWEDSIDRSPQLVKEIKPDPEAIVKKIEEMGIVGLGGATFPTHIKYMNNDDRKIDTLVINGVECEPYLTSDHRLMVERPDEIMVGIQIMMKAGKVNRALVGIEANKPDAIAVMTEKAGEYPGVEVVPLKVKYPQGAEKQLIKALLDREIPSGKLPIDVGVIINNVGTALAIYEAVQKNKPLVERVVTITGKNLKKDGNFLARIGVSATKLLETRPTDGFYCHPSVFEEKKPKQDFLPMAEGISASFSETLGEELPENTGKIICGGPMMGKAVNSLDIPITKGTSGMVLLDESETLRPISRNCIRCAKCVNACPMGLEPYLLEKLANRDYFDRCEAESINDCMECGSCSYTCPSAIPLLDYIRYGKTNVMRIQRERRQK